jgi:hypothetical protein
MQRSGSHLSLAALAAGIALSVLSVTAPVRAKDADSAAGAAVELQLHRLWAVTEVQNLMGTYSFWHTSGFNHRVPELFTQTDDTVIEMMWGRYTGKDAAHRVYFIDHRRDDQGAIDALGLKVPAVESNAEAPGGAGTAGGPSSMAPFHLHSLTTPVIEVAGDGETARAVWISPGSSRDQ